MDYIQLGWAELGFALLFMVVAIVIVAIERLGQVRSMITGTVRAFVQLMAVGYILEGIFLAEQWWVTALALLAMGTVAAFTAYGRQEIRLPGLLPLIFVSIVAGTLLTLLPTLLIILKLDNTFHPQYAIPLGSMILSPALNAVSLGYERMLSDIKLRRAEIETYLSLGANRRQALSSSGAAALRAGMISYMNKLMTLGLVAFPGMMTGQIIAGVSPIDAVKYQIVIMYMIVVSAAITGAISIALLRRLVINRKLQLVRLP
ncbi:MAG TPA: iron export ABC transporter permease subunit FetB [Acidobacteriota bacterium]|nr:iron export ABC transporter permease subunit FetB [Acidobacteriota bacterium]